MSDSWHYWPGTKHKMPDTYKIGANNGKELEIKITRKVDLFSNVGIIQPVKNGEYYIYNIPKKVFCGGYLKITSCEGQIYLFFGDVSIMISPATEGLIFNRGGTKATRALLDELPTQITTTKIGGVVMKKQEKELAKLKKKGMELQTKAQDVGLFSMFRSKKGQAKLSGQVLETFKQICSLQQELGIETADIDYSEEEMENASFDHENNVFVFSKKSSKNFSMKFTFGNNGGDDVIDV